MDYHLTPVKMIQFTSHLTIFRNNYPKSSKKQTDSLSPYPDQQKLSEHPKILPKQNDRVFQDQGKQEKTN